MRSFGLAWWLWWGGVWWVVVVLWVTAVVVRYLSAGRCYVCDAQLWPGEATCRECGASATAEEEAWEDLRRRVFGAPSGPDADAENASNEEPKPCADDRYSEAG